MKKIMNTFLILIILLPAAAYAEGKMQIAVLDFKSRGVSKTLSQVISDILRAEMVKTGFFVVVERDQMDSILKEQGFQKTGCTDSDCAVQLGKLLSAKKILLGEVSKLGSSILITVRIVDVEKGVAEFAETEKAEKEDNVDEACRMLTKKLTKNIVGGRRTDYAGEDKNEKFKQSYEIYENAKKSHVTGCCLGAIVPGGQHFYSGNYFTGAAYLVSVIISYAVFTNNLSRESDAENEADKDRYNRYAGWAAGITSAIRIADIIHGYYNIEGYNEELMKKINVLTGENKTEFDFNYSYNPKTMDKNFVLGMSLKF